MSPRKYAPLFIGALLLTTLLLLYFSRSMNWNWNQTHISNGVKPIEPAGGQRVTELSTDLYVTVSVSSTIYSRLLERNEIFMNEHPHIRVHLTNETDHADRYALITDQYSQGFASDVLLIDNSWVVPFAVKGYLKPIDRLMTGDVLSDQLTGLLEPLKWNGYLWAAPHHINPYVVAWNKEMLEEAGLSEPPQGWSSFQALWERLVSSAASETSERYAVNFRSGDLLQLLIWLNRFEERQGELIKLRLLSSKQQEQLLWLQSNSGVSMTGPMEKRDQMSGLIEDNKLLMVTLPWEEMQSLGKAAMDKLIVEKEAIHYSWLNGSSFVISSGSKVENEAMLWIQEVTNAVSGSKYAHSGNQLPVRASLYAGQAGMLASLGGIPHSWWLKSLNSKLPEGEILAPDPLWPMRWVDWEKAWATHSEQSLRMDSWIEAIAKLNERNSPSEG